jgi:very-short-patch-repair endonuclease
MSERRPKTIEPHIWALRDRSIVPVNKTRALAMRSEPAEAERKLWWNLRHRLALPTSHFRRQVHLGRYIVEFASHSLKIVIEIDGGQHAVQRNRTQCERSFLSPRAIASCVSGTMKSSATSTVCSK